MISYFDASALVKLLLEEDGADIAASFLDGSSSIVTNRLAYVETRAALAAARRAIRITDADLARAKREFESLFGGFDLVDVSDSLVRAAGDVAERYALRGYDAVHLAAAMFVGDVVLVTWDADLARAASKAGLATAGIR